MSQEMVLELVRLERQVERRIRGERPADLAPFTDEERDTARAILAQYGV